MLPKRIVCLLVLWIVPVLATDGLAEVEYNIQRTLKTAAPPIDIAVSANGQRIFVLTETGNILVYSPAGRLQDKIDVGRHIDQIEIGPKEDLLLIKSRKNRTIQILALDFIRKISTFKSPFKGPANAPVTIIVFSDFQ